MKPYLKMSEEELAAELGEYLKARRKIVMGAGVATIAGEGRRLEFTKVDRGALDDEIAAIYAAAAVLGYDLGQPAARTAIGVGIG